MSIHSGLSNPVIIVLLVIQEPIPLVIPSSSCLEAATLIIVDDHASCIVGRSTWKRSDSNSGVLEIVVVSNMITSDINLHKRTCSDAESIGFVLRIKTRPDMVVLKIDFLERTKPIEIDGSQWLSPILRL